MWNYDKKLLYPVKICKPDPAMAKLIMSQLGGPDGELGAATRYLSQRYAQPYAQGKAILSDVGTGDAKCTESECTSQYEKTRGIFLYEFESNERTVKYWESNKYDELTRSKTAKREKSQHISVFVDTEGGHM